jgi:hypothetical protein
MGDWGRRAVDVHDARGRLSMERRAHDGTIAGNHVEDCGRRAQQALPA